MITKAAAIVDTPGKFSRHGKTAALVIAIRTLSRLVN